MSAVTLLAGAQELGINLSEQQLSQFSLYAKLLAEWNEKINLTAIPANDYETLHFLDSLSVVPCLKRAFGSCLTGLHCLDVGSGAGFPGVPLKIVIPELRVVLLDSIRKKMTFIEALKNELGVEIEVICDRAEIAAHRPELREKFDIVVSRAVAAMPSLVHWTLPFVRPGGRFFALKASAVEGELQEAHNEISLLGGAAPVTHTICLPVVKIERSIVEIEKSGPSPANLPKRQNAPKKRAL